MSKGLKRTLIRILVIIAAIAAVLTFNSIMIGDTFVFRYENLLDGDVSMEAEPEEEGILSVEKIENKDGIIENTLKGIKPGMTQVVFRVRNSAGEDSGVVSTFYVHASGLITEGGFIGTTNNFHIIGIEFVIFLFLLFAHRVWLCIKTSKKNMYSYALPGHMGVALFLLAMTILFILISVRQGAVYYKLYVMTTVLSVVFMLFSLAAFPIIFILSVFMISSNIALIRHEGKSPSNTLGIILGVFLCVMTFGHFFIEALLRMIDIKNQALDYFVETSLGTFIYSLLIYLECLMASTLFCTLRAQHFVPAFDKDYIIILGCAIGKDGTPTPLLKGRIDRALWFANRQKEETGKDIIFVPSGGQGSDEVISEAQSIKNYLLEHGVDEEHILLEDKSTNTRENMAFSKKLIEERNEDASVAFSTTGYHVFRSGNIARGIGLHATGIGSRTKWYFYVNALIREFAANLSAEKRRHITNTIYLAVYAMLLAFVSYNVY